MKFLQAFLVVSLLCGICTAQEYVVKTQETVIRENLEYCLYFPEGYDPEGTSRFPLLLFLHGGGESGENPGNPHAWLPQMLTDGTRLPFLVLAPHNAHSRKWWDVRAVMQLLDTVVANNKVDRDRVYLAGISRGGGAAWELAVNYPGKFAALAVVSGMAPVAYASWIEKAMPIWVFHGKKDPYVPFSGSEAMVEKLREMGHTVKFTTYPRSGHDIQGKAFREEGLYDWLLHQKRK